MRWEGESDWKGEGPSIQMPSQLREKHSCFSPASKLHKIENTKDLLNRQTCHGILCISTQSPHNRALHMTHQRVRGSRAGRPKSSDVGIVRREQYGLVHCDNRKRPIANMAGGLWAVYVGFRLVYRYRYGLSYFFCGYRTETLRVSVSNTTANAVCIRRTKLGSGGSTGHL